MRRPRSLRARAGRQRGQRGNVKARIDLPRAPNGAVTPGGGRDPRRRGRPRAAGRARQRRRRRGLLLRVGPGSAGVLLEGVRGQREAQRHRRPSVRGDLVRRASASGRACGSPPTGSLSSASRRRPLRAASTPEHGIHGSPASPPQLVRWSSSGLSAGEPAFGRTHLMDLMRHVVVYHAEGCHLCERALEVVDEARPSWTSS